MWNFGYVRSVQQNIKLWKVNCVKGLFHVREEG